MQPTLAGRSKPRGWKDVNLIISSIALAISLGLWSMWASREKFEAKIEVAKDKVAPPEMLTPTPGMSLLPGQILYLSTPVPTPSASVVSQEQPSRRRDRDGGGGGGGGRADAGTGSS